MHELCRPVFSKHRDTTLMTLSIHIGKEGTNIKPVPAATKKKDKKQEQQQ